MALADLKNVLNLFGGKEISEDQQNELFKEVLLMTLARAADVDRTKGQDDEEEGSIDPEEGPGGQVRGVRQVDAIVDQHLAKDYHSQKDGADGIAEHDSDRTPACLQVG